MPIVVVVGMKTRTMQVDCVGRKSTERQQVQSNTVDRKVAVAYTVQESVVVSPAQLDTQMDRCADGFVTRPSFDENQLVSSQHHLVEDGVRKSSTRSLVVHDQRIVVS